MVGAGPAGLACAVTAAERGHDVTLFDAAAEIGGQFNLAKRIPGKEEFDETLRYFRAPARAHGVERAAEHARRRPRTSRALRRGRARHRRHPAHAGDRRASTTRTCVSYVDVLRDGAPVGDRVAIIGAGGIGFDVAEFLHRRAATRRARTRRPTSAPNGASTPTTRERGGLRRARAAQAAARRSCCSSARTSQGRRRPRQDHRLDPPHGAQAPRRDDGRRRRRTSGSTTPGLHITVDGRPRTLAVDTVVLCTGQEPRRDLYEELLAAGRSRAPDRRRRRGRRARRQARHRPGHGAGGGPVSACRLPAGPPGPALGFPHVTPARDPHRPAREAVVGAGADPPVRPVDRLLLVGHASADLSRAGKAGAGRVHPGAAQRRSRPAGRRRSSRCSFRGGSREEGLKRVAEAIASAAQGLDLAKSGLTVLIENSAGAEFSLGSSLDQLAELLERLKGVVPIAACIDTCHTHVAGYDIVSEEGMNQTLRYLDLAIELKNIPVWHCNDAKAARGSRLDRHQHIGKGGIGQDPFRRLLHDPRLGHAAFIAETPIDKPGDDLRNVHMLHSLAPKKDAVSKRQRIGPQSKTA